MKRAVIRYGSLKVFGILSPIFLFTGCFQPDIKSVTIAKWKNNARAAYTIIHDDLCDTVCSGIFEFADTIAFNRGLRIASGAIVQNCVSEGEYMWEHLRQMAGHGHEILSHSWDHGSAIDLGWQPESWSVDTDVVMSRAVLEQQVPGIKVTYFIFPYDAYNDQRLDELKANGYLGARAGRKMYEDDRGVNISFDPFDPFRNCYFDAYMSKAEQDAIDTLPEDERYTVSIYNDDNDDVEIRHVDSALAVGGWSIQEMHSVDDAQPWGWGHISIAKYRALLDYVKTKIDSGALWMETPTAVIKYIFTRNHAGDAIIKDNLLHFSGAENIETIHATEITALITTRWNPSEITAVQEDQVIPVTKLGKNRFRCSVDPVKGDVTFLLDR